MEIVFVLLYNFQEYILDNIENCRRFGNNNIAVLTDEKFKDKFDLDCNVVTVESLVPEYSLLTKNLQRTFRNGFQQLTSLRFRILYEYMIQHNKKHILHLENDVMIFHDFANFQFHTDKILITMDAINRSVPGIMYFPNGDMAKTCYENFDHSKSDMFNWAYCFHHIRNLVDTLPIYVPKTKNWDSAADKWDYKLVSNQYDFYNGIFDAAAIGQYLGGIDPRNNETNDPSLKAGFVSQDCIIDYSKHKIVWEPTSVDYKAPFLVVDDTNVPIFNIHVHCKDLRQFM